jgi:hypothetical protein
MSFPFFKPSDHSTPTAVPGLETNTAKFAHRFINHSYAPYIVNFILGILLTSGVLLVCNGCAVLMGVILISAGVVLSIAVMVLSKRYLNPKKDKDDHINKAVTVFVSGMITPLSILWWVL